MIHQLLAPTRIKTKDGKPFSEARHLGKSPLSK